MFGNNSSSFLSASPVRSSFGILSPSFSSSSFVSVNVKYFDFGIFSSSFRISKSSLFFFRICSTMYFIAPSISFIVSFAEAKAISISICRHSFRCRTVLCFSARHTGVIVTMFSIAHAIICL